MARRIVALILGLSVLGLFTTWLLLSKEAGIEVDTAEDSAETPASLPVRIAASAYGDIRVDGRPVDLAGLADEIRRIISAAEEASLPEPAFVIAVAREADNAILVMILEALSEGGATSVSIDTEPAE